VLVIPASIGSTKWATAELTTFSPSVRCAFSALFVIGGSFGPGLGTVVLTDAILTPTKESPLLSSQVQQAPGHLRSFSASWRRPLTLR
jgi:hypothetical protein